MTSYLVLGDKVLFNGLGTVVVDMADPHPWRAYIQRGNWEPEGVTFWPLFLWPLSSVTFLFIGVNSNLDLRVLVSARAKVTGFGHRGHRRVSLLSWKVTWYPGVEDIQAETWRRRCRRRPGITGGEQAPTGPRSKLMRLVLPASWRQTGRW